MEILDKQELEDVRSIDAYERDCSRAASHRTSVDVSAAASKLMLDEKRAYVEKHAQLAADQSLQNAIDELINLKVFFAKHEMKINAAMYGNKQAVFRDYASKGISYGELAFTTIQYPLEQLDMTHMRPLNISPTLTTHGTCVWSLSSGFSIVTQSTNSPCDHLFDSPTPMTRLFSFDPSGRLVNSVELDAGEVIGDVNVNDQLVISDYTLSGGLKLWLFDANLNCSREKSVRSYYQRICCNSMYAFCAAKENDNLVVDVRRLDTLAKVSRLHLFSFHDIHTILANESYLCAVSLYNANQIFMSYFDLSGNMAARVSRIVPDVPVNSKFMMYSDWIACLSEERLTWFDKSGSKSSTITELVIPEGAAISQVSQSGQRVLFHLADDRVFATS